MENNKVLSYIGLAKRAGKCLSGEEKVLSKIRINEAKLVIIAVDASENTTKKFKDKCNSYHVPLIQYKNRSELGQSLGVAERVVIAITDDGFVKMIMKGMEKEM
ncbi:L7Ae/L30e/S12e/Gadd45 family ribosomal protein [Chengkuizengella axinellae]|uniref:Ribosomal L7Ae/L30e/S12e/Gadd45 family protein n=1 Tax=Chengkuizengella axinellae TaxID=3064388 RepID=A0ABT9IWK8_9BACL|nr:ribosomal L7Ae/L30e/S12e/Gadd45 family protein [Chengkuizengella sp. 2205SS18-9]MDP5273482.1 ribosomal L7Ae/L30e/S12e/Gadd45 family protein [Chengkuizengella sp. 2205SS18-9]